MLRWVRDALRVIAGLDPAIHEDGPRVETVRFRSLRGLMDARIKPGMTNERLS